jgi:hypothetical protein
MVIGQRVKLKPTSEFYINSPSGQLPPGATGILYKKESTSPDWYAVEWFVHGDRKSNNYRPDDLMPCDFDYYYKQIQDEQARV